MTDKTRKPVRTTLRTPRLIALRDLDVAPENMRFD